MEAALRKGVHLLPVHEMPSAVDDDPQRGACAFNDFWNDCTPNHLLKGDANIYKQIAIALKPGAWRKAGLATVVGKMAKGGGERQPVVTTLPAAASSPGAAVSGASVASVPDVQIDMDDAATAESAAPAAQAPVPPQGMLYQMGFLSPPEQAAARDLNA